MILQALYEYYHRMKACGDPELPPYGFTREGIHFVLVIDKNGNLVGVQDVRDVTGKKPQAIRQKVPEAVIRSSNIAANFLWDNSGYVLGVDLKKKSDKTLEKFNTFKKLLHTIGDDVHDPGMKAVIKFIDSWKPNKLPPHVDWQEIAGKNLAFRLDTERCFIHERPAVIEAWLDYKRKINDSLEKGQCLITGKIAGISQLHNPIKGIYDPGGQVQKRIVSFNMDAFTSSVSYTHLTLPTIYSV